MGKECWRRSALPNEPVLRSLGPALHPLVLAAGPPNDIGVEAIRKTPYTEAELHTLAADLFAMNRDTPVWRNLIAQVGEQEAVAIGKQRLAARDPLSLINWEPVGAKH